MPALRAAGSQPASSPAPQGPPGRGQRTRQLPAEHAQERNGVRVPWRQPGKGSCALGGT